MSKVLRVVGTVASIAAVIPGPHQPFAAAIAVAAGIGAQLTAKPPVAKGQVNNIIIGANNPLPYMIGRTYSGGVQVHDVGWGGEVDDVQNPYRFLAVVYSCCGPVQALDSVQLDYTTISFTGTAATGYYANFLYRDWQLGTRPESDALVPEWAGTPDWGASYKLSSMAAIGYSFKWDKKSKRYPGGQMPLIGAVWQGVKVYDPRLDSTYPGGSGTHRIDDETTWTYSTNPALHAGTYAYGRTVSGKKVFGVHLGADAIRLDQVVTWANTCDANSWTAGGTIFEPGDKWNNLKRISEAGAGEPVIAGGLLGFDFQTPRVSLYTVTRDDLAAGPVAGKLGRGFKAKHNTLVPRYRSEDHQWTYQQAGAVSDVAWVTADGEVKSDERQWDLVTDLNQVTELAIYDLWLRRAAGPFRLSCKPHMRIWGPGDCLTLSAELGVHPSGAVKAVVKRRTVDLATGIVQLELDEENDDKHTAALGATGSVTAPPTLPTSEDLDTTHADNAALPTLEVADEAEMIAIGGPGGQVVTRADTGETYQHNGGTSGTAADWTLIGLTSVSADNVAFIPTGGLSATDVQAALVELDAEKQPLDADLTTWAGITPGTGVGAALAVNVGSAGAFVTFNGAGGTPSSLTLTNATGLPVAGGGTGRATSTTAYGLIAAGTTATGAHQTLAAGATTEILVGGGASALPVWTTATGTGAPARAGGPTFTGTLTAATIAASGFMRINSASGGLGYAVGAGSTVTQITSKATGVAINRPNGTVTMHNATLNAGASVTFTMTNNTTEVNDHIFAYHHSAGTWGAYRIEAHVTGSTTTDFQVTNISGGNLGEAIVIKFIFFKGSVT